MTNGKRSGIITIAHNATVAQQVEQLTRNEQVVRSNRISSSTGNSHHGYPNKSHVLIWCVTFVVLGKRYEKQKIVSLTEEAGATYLTGEHRFYTANHHLANRPPRWNATCV